MAITYKDINQLTQKSQVAGTEKIPVSDTEFITPSQIVDGCPTMEEAGLTEIVWQNITPTARVIASNGNWANPTGQTKSVIIPITPLKTYRVVAYDSTAIAVLTSGTYGNAGSPVSFATGFSGRIVLNDDETYSFTSPSNGLYLYLNATDYYTGETNNVRVVEQVDNYPKYVLCANEAAYAAITNKDSGTLYLIPE